MEYQVSLQSATKMSSAETNQTELKMPDTRLVLDDLPSKHFLRFYSLFEHYALLMATISCFGTTFVIAKASTEKMKKYKWFLFHEIAWSYLFDICMCLLIFVPLFPYQCAYSIGLLRYTNPYAMQAVIKFAIACGVGKGFSLFIALLHRNVQALPTCSFKERYQNSTRLKKVFFAIWLILEIIIVGPFFFADIQDQQSVQDFFSSQDPIIKQVYLHEPSTVCYVLDSKTTIIYGIVYSIASLAILAFVPLLLNMLYWILKSKKTVNPSTFRVQWMLFTSISIQVICCCFFLLVPFYVGVLVDLLAVPKASIILCVLICVACLHSTLDCLVIIIFIKPYRDFVFGNLLRLIGLSQPENLTSVTSVTVISGLELRSNFKSTVKK